MSRLSTSALALLALLVPGFAHAEAPAAATLHVIAPGNEKLFLEMTDPKPGKFAGSWSLDEASLRKDTALLTYVDGKGGKAQLLLAHPGTPGKVLGTSARFALLQPDGPAAPRPLADALLARLRQKEEPFRWVEVTAAPASDDKKASTPPASNQGWPTIPDDAVSAERLKRLEYPMPSPDERAQIEKLAAKAREGTVDPARQEARALLARHAGDFWTTLAVSMVLRASGDGGGAALLLAPLSGKAASEGDEDRLRLELAAAYELAKQPAEAAKALAGRKRAPAGGAECGRAEALTLLVQEGRAHDVLGLTADLIDMKDPQPRCMLQARMRAAIAAHDGKALDAAAERAIKRDPRDANLLYLWGSYYYERQEFESALRAWDRLAPIDGNYPGFLGLYGTSWHVLGRLKVGDTLTQLIARARKNPDDVVANHLAGIGLYYDRRYAEVIPMLENVLKHNDEPRAGMYLAMSHFFTGDVDGAIKMLDDLEPVAHREPDIYYCRSLVWRFYDMPRAIKEMQIFLDVFLNEQRPAYGQQKIEKAKDDLARMKKGEIPSVYLAGQGSYTPPPRKSSK